MSNQGFVIKAVCLAVSVGGNQEGTCEQDLYPYSILAACSNHSYYSTNPGTVPPYISPVLERQYT